MARTMQTVTQEAGERLTAGVDTHAEQHVAVALGPRGQRLGSAVFPATPEGYAAVR